MPDPAPEPQPRALPPSGGDGLVLRGERLGLAPRRSADAELYAAWMNDPAVRHGVNRVSLFDAALMREAIERGARAAAEREPALVEFAIHDLADHAPIGLASLSGISFMHRRAGFGILLGARRGDGRGTEATRLVLRWAFDVLGLRNVMLDVLATNAAAIRAYEHAGFERIGVRRGAACSDGRPADLVLMDATPPGR